MQYSQNVVDGIKYTKFKRYSVYDDSSRSKYLFLKNKRNMYLDYYGTYNGYVVARSGIEGADIKIYDEKIIGGVSFYNYMTLTVYDINS